MLIFKCPTCDDSPMGFNEAEQTWICSDGECQHELSAEETTTMFEAGELIAFVEDDIDEEFDTDLDEGEKPDFGKKKKDDDDDSDDDSDDDDDDDDDDEKDESFNGFENKDTWTVNLIVQNEYMVQKGALAAVSSAKEDSKDDALKTFIEKKVAKNDEYSEILDSVDLDEVNWTEIVDSVVEGAAEFEQIRADLKDALGVNEAISEEENDAIVTVFESALTVKYNELKANLEEKFENDLAEAQSEIDEALKQEMSGYLDEVVEEWMSENKLAIEQGIRTEKTEKFLEGLAELFSNHYIEVPEDRFDIIEDMSDKLEQQDEELSASKAREAALQENLDKANKVAIINKLSEGLTDTQVEKLEELAGSIDYESEETFEGSLQTLKESFLKTPKNKKDGDVVTVDESLNEDDDVPEKTVDLNDPIARAAHGLRRT